MRLYLNDWVDQHIFATGDYETMVSSVVKRTLSEGDHFVDAGANIGYFTLLGSRCVGADGRVTAFEPASSTRLRLEQNIALNECKNVSVRPEAISDSIGALFLNNGPTCHSGVASLRQLADAGGTEQVKVVDLASIFSQERAPRLFKIDIEGAEVKAIRGLLPALKSWIDCPPDFIIEYSPAFLESFGDDPMELPRLLSDFGYHFARIDWNGLVRIEVDDFATSAQFNIFAFKRESSENIAASLGYR